MLLLSPHHIIVISIGHLYEFLLFFDILTHLRSMEHYSTVSKEILGRRVCGQLKFLKLSLQIFIVIL